MWGASKRLSPLQGTRSPVACALTASRPCVS
uniref:Uncharacterized protein n=1 Tax=Arundo donax TaxID=35708 RepID=A0A0A8ZJF5_ARUDO